MTKFVIGLDFGTDSIRALLVNAHTGEELSQVTQAYPRWRDGKYCDISKNLFRQHPLDYLESLEVCVTKILAEVSKETASNIAAISIATTGSTPVAVNQEGMPLSLLPEFAENLNAMFVLWKDHTANEESDEINKIAHNWPTDYTKYSGGTYSSEWFWSKILHIVRTDKDVSQNAFSWVEHCDWMPAVLSGNTNPLLLKRSRCAAGHKAMWHEEFGGLPSLEFLNEIDTKLGDVRSNLFEHTYTADQPAGIISEEWSLRLGLPKTTIIGVGAIDAHVGAVGAGIKPNTLVKVIGTSTCDMIVAPRRKIENKIIKGICGQVNGSIIPNQLGMEAGQSAFGDYYAWFQNLLSFPLKEILKDDLSMPQKLNLIDRILPYLSDKAASLPVTEHDVLAVDWINGRRTPDADLNLTGAFIGLKLGSDVPDLFKAMVEATAFGSKAIIERFREEGIFIKDIVALGGITKKSRYVLQTLANVLNVPINVVQSEQTCALGSAMFAATVAGIYSTVEDAQKNMSSQNYDAYLPDNSKAEVYEKLYNRYLKIGSFIIEDHKSRV